MAAKKKTAARKKPAPQAKRSPGSSTTLVTHNHELPKCSGTAHNKGCRRKGPEVGCIVVRIPVSKKPPLVYCHCVHLP